MVVELEVAVEVVLGPCENRIKDPAAMIMITIITTTAIMLEIAVEMLF